jgi:hypothetical protein
LGRFISPDTIVPDPANPQSLNRYAYVGNNPLKYTDPSGHWSEEDLNGALGENWRERYFGKGAVFEGREKLLNFLTSSNTSGPIVLGLTQNMFAQAASLHDIGANFSNFDALGERVVLSGGSALFGAVSGDAILNLSSGEFSIFVSPELGALLGESVQAVAGYTAIKTLPSNDAYRGVFWAGGGLVGAYGSLNGEFFWSAPMSDRFNPADTAHGGFVGAGAAIPEAGVYLSLSYSLEVYREDVRGSHGFPFVPAPTTIADDLGQAVWHDVVQNPIWPNSPYR